MSDLRRVGGVFFSVGSRKCREAEKKCLKRFSNSREKK